MRPLGLMVEIMCNSVGLCYTHTHTHTHTHTLMHASVMECVHTEHTLCFTMHTLHINAAKRWTASLRRRISFSWKVNSSGQMGVYKVNIHSQKVNVHFLIYNHDGAI